jgi:hypothetical protein
MPATNASPNWWQCTDQLCWTTGKQLSLIDRTQENARQKLRDIVSLAYDSLHD